MLIKQQRNYQNEKLNELALEKIQQVETEKSLTEAKKEELERNIEQLMRVDIVAVTRHIESQVKNVSSLKAELEMFGRSAITLRKHQRTWLISLS